MKWGATSYNMVQKTNVQNFQASFAPGTLTKMPLRSSRKIGTHFGQRLAAERKASAENQPKVFLTTVGA